MAVAQPTPRGPRRRHRRYRTHVLLVDHPVSGRVVNVGKRGFAIETPDRLFVGGHYVFRVRLGPKQLSLSGQIQWCRLVGTRAEGGESAQPLFRAGISLDDTTSSKAWRAALHKLTRRAPHVILHRARSQPPKIPFPTPEA